MGAARSALEAIALGMYPTRRSGDEQSSSDWGVGSARRASNGDISHAGLRQLQSMRGQYPPLGPA